MALIAGLLVIALAVVIAVGLSHHGHGAGKVTSNSLPSYGTSVPIKSPGFVSSLLPVYECATTYGISTITQVNLPKSVRELISQNEIGKLAVFADGADWVRLVGPSQWDCSASDSADGSSSLSIGPPNSAMTSGKLSSESKVEEITANQDGSGSGGAIVQACPLFSNARQLASTSGESCPTKPRLEKSSWVSSDAVEFVDPPGLAGDGSPSGGQYPAYGVLIFKAGAFDSGYLATCVMPPSDRSICGTVLINFTNAYG